MEAWASGHVSEDTEFKQAVMNAAAIRESQVLEEIADLSNLDLEEVQ